MLRILLMLLLLLVPQSGDASFNSAEDVWFCRVVGEVEHQKTMFVTPLWKDAFDNHYQQREDHFIEYIEKVMKKQKKSFKPSFQAKCRDYVEADRAEKHRELEIATAKKYKFKVIELKWSWVPNDRQAKQ